MEYQDDDYYDVDSGDDMDVDTDTVPVDDPRLRQNLGLVVQMYSQNVPENSMRQMDAFIQGFELDHYRPEWVANPLRNENTARVFGHFIHATAPALSIHERTSSSSSAIFTQRQLPPSQQSIWTYTLPMMALGNQGLLHAMLALGSLHIAKLQGASVTPSFKHYAYALKRIHQSVSNSKKRHQIATIAATLLLGFYEVMTAEHLKWCSHLSGARVLLVELDLKGMTKEAKRMKQEQADFDSKARLNEYELLSDMRPHDDVFTHRLPLPDERIISTIVGRKLRYDMHGRVVEDFDGAADHPVNTEMPDMSKYELLQDLFWWYLRQDAYQSILSGNPLLYAPSYSGSVHKLYRLTRVAG